MNLPLDPTGEPSPAERSLPSRAPLTGAALSSVEERILALQERKRALAEGVLGGGGAVGGITREDLLALLE